MGFYWGVEAQVAFVQPVAVPGDISWPATLGALRLFDGDTSRTLFAAAARALPDLQIVPESLAKRARLYRSLIITREEAEAGSGDEDDFDLVYNHPEEIEKAAQAAIDDVLGVKDSGISLVLMHASESCGGSADDTELLFVHKPTAVKPAGAANENGAGDGRGSVNWPFGLSITDVPPIPTNTAGQMQALLHAFGMDAKGPAGLRLITSASGG
jgi:hypothetical protein